MKKTLLILSLVLALCMLCGIALADDDGDSEFGGYSYEEAMRIHEIDGHNVTNPRLQRESTCLLRGIMRFDCETDPTHFHEVYLELADHRWVVTTTLSDCTEGGTVTRECSVCHKVETVNVPALGHIWSSEYNNPNGNWTDEDKRMYSPKDYNLSSSMPNDFSWGRVIKEPKCTEPGEAIDFCPRCGATRDKTREIAPLGHDWAPTDAIIKAPNCLEPGLKTYQKVCLRCGLIEVDPDQDVNDGEVDGYEEIPVPQPAPYEYHDWDEWIIVKEPTCFEDGLELHWCMRCGDKQERTIDKLDPVWEARDSRLIHCYLKETTYYCVNCYGRAPGHEDWTEQEDVVAHTFIHPTDGAGLVASYIAQGEDWDAFLDSLSYVKKDRCVKPTCEDEGLLVFMCIYDGVDHFDCDHIEGQDYEYHEVVLPALGHDFNPWELRYAPHYNGNENAYGYWLRDCNRCGRYEERISYFAPEDTCEEHIWFTEEDGTVTVIDHKDPTCTEAGYDALQCKVCGYIEHRPINALDHDWDVREFVATCTEAGKEIKICLRCGEVVINEIPAKGHTEVEVKGYAATCVEDGLTDGTVCSVCGTVLVPQEIDQCRGYHIYEDVPAQPATCTEVGYTSGGVCECGAALGHEEIPALGHDYKPTVVAPTCTEEGYTLYTCSRCGDEYTEDNVPALGHTWDDPKTIKEPTYDEAGEIRYTCIVCGKQYEEEVPALNLDPADYKFDGGVSYAGNKITGTVNHVYGTADCRLYARVTAFFVGGSVAVFSDIVEDGIVDIELRGNVLAYSVELVGTKATLPGQKVFDNAGEYFRAN